MTARYILREYHEGRKNAKRAAKRRGYPFHLIYKVTRHANENT
ncbi:hypothetical protein [Vreelandella aquamarina]|nr:hypothetical protein [Halomonas meridiana]